MDNRLHPGNQEIESPSRGYIYIAINEAMPGFVKIGQTRSLDGRLKSLYASSVPYPFAYYYAAKVIDPEWVESKLHEAFADRRASSNREFFRSRHGKRRRHCNWHPSMT